MLEEIGGDLFLGEYFGEAGSDKAAKDKGYYVEGNDVIALQMPPQNFRNMQEAKDNFVNFIKSMTQYDSEIGLTKTSLVEATALSRYELEGGIQTPVLEVLPGDPEKLLAFTRGAAIGYKRTNWGGFIACEWYGGYRHEDILKKARLELAYKYLYLSGANITLLESGNNEIRSFGYDLGYDSEICRDYRKAQKDFQEFIEKIRVCLADLLQKSPLLRGIWTVIPILWAEAVGVSSEKRNGEMVMRKKAGAFYRKCTVRAIGTILPRFPGKGQT